MTRPNRTRTWLRGLAPAVLASFLVAPAAGAYSWEQLREDFEYEPVAFIIAIPAFIVTAPIMAVEALIESARDGDSGEA